MQKSILIVLAGVLLASGGLYAEEIFLRDGTNVTGRMLAIKGDSIEVQTRYGKIRIRRTDIVRISFPENEPKPESVSEPEKPLAPIEEKLEGVTYTNRTGKFILTVPMEWKINKELRQGEALAALSSGDNLRFLVVVHETFSGSLEAYKGLVELQLKRAIAQYEKLSELAVTIDGRPGLLVVFRGVEPKSNLPVAYLVGIVAHDTQVAKITAVCAEPLFNESQTIFEKIILSYRKIQE